MYSMYTLSIEQGRIFLCNKVPTVPLPTVVSQPPAEFFCFASSDKLHSDLTAGRTYGTVHHSRAMILLV